MPSSRTVAVFGIIGFLLGTLTAFAYFAWFTMPRVNAPVRLSKHSDIQSAQSAVGPVRAAAGAGVLRAPAPPKLDEATKAAIVAAYYNAINAGDFVLAYNLLSDDFHTYQSFDQFRQAYASTIQMTLRGTRDYEGQPAIGLALIDAERNGDGTLYNGYVGYLKFAYDRKKDRWLIDERKLMKVASQDVQPPQSLSAAEANATSTSDSVTNASTATNSDTPPADGVGSVPTSPPNCQPETIATFSNGGLTVILQSGGSFDLASAVDWTENDVIDVCESGGEITLRKGDSTVSATRHE